MQFDHQLPSSNFSIRKNGKEILRNSEILFAQVPNNYVVNEMIRYIIQHEYVRFMNKAPAHDY